MQYSSNNTVLKVITPQKNPTATKKKKKFDGHSGLNFKGGEKRQQLRKGNPHFYSVKVFCCVILNYEHCNEWQLRVISFLNIFFLLANNHYLINGLL